jgi:hypothetical protein
MPRLDDLPKALRDLRDERWRRFAWNYAFNGACGAYAARDAGYSDVKKGAAVRAHYLLRRDDVQAAIMALWGKYLSTPLPMMRLFAKIQRTKKD